MSDAKVFPLHAPNPHQKQIDFLREIANDLADNPGAPRVAVAMFINWPDDGIDVHCGGFADDQAAIKYLSAFIRNQGFAAS